MVTKAKIVVIGGSNPNTLGLLRSLGYSGYSVELLLTRPNLKGASIRFSRYAGKIHCLPAGKSIVQMLKETYANESTPPILLHGSDSIAGQLDDAYEELNGLFRFFNASGRSRFFLDKSNTFPLAKASGLDIIKTWRMKDIDAIPSDVEYPVLLKGNNSLDFNKGDIVICRDEDELKRRFVRGRDLLIQEYIENGCELDLAGISINHGRKVMCPVVVRKLRNSLQSTADYVKIEPVEDYPMVDVSVVSDFLKRIGYEGLFSLDLISRGRKCYFLEINLRHGANGCLYTAAKVNFPAMWVKYCSGEDVVLTSPRTPQYLMDFNDFRNIGTKVGFWRWLWQCANADVHFVANWKDPLPALYEFSAKIIRTIKRFLGLMPKVG